MDKRNILIIVSACIVTAILVGFEVYLWQNGTTATFIPKITLPTGNRISNDVVNTAVNNGGTSAIKPNANYNEIKTKEEGIATCEYNRSYAKTVANTEQKKVAEAMVDYCYAVIAGKFNDLNLCQKATDKNGCRQTAQQLIDMGKEIENLPAEQKQQMQDTFKNLYKQQ